MTGIAFLDSTKLGVCHNRRIGAHRVFDGLARRGKTSVDWFFGFKLHLVVNDRGEVLAFRLTPGNVDDRIPVLTLVRGLPGKLVADRGYISAALTQALATLGIHLVVKPRKNMKNKLTSVLDKVLIRSRVIIENVIDYLKNVAQVEPQSTQFRRQFPKRFGCLFF